MDRKKLVTTAALVIGALVVVFVFTSDDLNITGLTGTMAPSDTVAGVNPASRYRAPQIAQDDLQLDDATFVQLMQNESFREIVQTGDMALVAAIEALARDVNLERTALAREEDLEDIAGLVATEEFDDFAEFAQEVDLEDLNALVENGDLETFAEVVQDEEVFQEIHEMAENDELDVISEWAKEEVPGFDDNVFDVVIELAESGELEIIEDFAETGGFEDLDSETADLESDLRDALEQFAGDGELQIDDKGIPRPSLERVQAFSRSERFGKLVALARADRELARADRTLEKIAQLARTGGTARLQRLVDMGRAADMARLARTGGAERLQRLARADRELARTDADLARTDADLARTGRTLERIATFARTDREGFARQVTFMRDARFQRIADRGLARTARALRRVDDLARSNELQRYAQLARTDGFDRVVEIARTSQLGRAMEMAREAGFDRTARDN